MVSVKASNMFRAFFCLAWIANNVAVVVATWEMNYTSVDTDMMGYMTIPSSFQQMDDSTVDSTIPENGLPAVVIVPDWDNVNDYEIARAVMISEELGYIAFTADIYGADLHDVQDFNVKVEQATKYRSDPALFNARINDAIETVKSSPFVDASRVAIIGYCLGGTGVIGYSFANTADADQNGIVGAVSFHGGLQDFDVTGEMASPVLVLSGGNDDAGTDVEVLENTLKAANATYQITRYSGVVHGFTNFNSPAYDEWVDKRSWMEMSSFLKERFGEVEYGTIEPETETDYTVIVNPVVGTDVSIMAARAVVTPTPTLITVETVAYDDAGFALEGYLAMPRKVDEEDVQQHPGLLIIPDWDGVNGPTGYEAGRAVMAANERGYVAMVADIYGSSYTNVEDMAKRVELATMYRSDPELFVGRIQAGIDQLVAHPSVDSSNIFVAGYCLGGTGAIDYGFSSGASLQNVKAVVPIHGGLTPLRAIQTDTVKPYVLVLSGGVDDAHGNPTELEAHLDGASATWEISRYSNAKHGFTKWGTGPFSAYDAMADSRSWWSMMSLFDTLRMVEDETTMVVDNTTIVEDKDETTMVVETTIVKDKEETDDHKMDGHTHDEPDMDSLMNESSANGRSVFGEVAIISTLLAVLAW